MAQSFLDTIAKAGGMDLQSLVTNLQNVTIAINGLNTAVTAALASIANPSA